MNISPSHSPHVTDVVIDYLEGRLPKAERGRIQAHLADCAECRTDFEFAAAIQTSTARRGLRHIHADRLVDLVESEGNGGTPAERLHLTNCQTCAREFSFLADLPLVEELEEAPVMRRVGEPVGWLESLRSFLTTPWSIGGAMAAAAVVLLMIAPWDRATDLSGLVDRSPLPVSMTREARDPDSFAGLRARGLEAYDEGNYAGAASFFERAVDLRPEDAEILLYLGSSRLLTDDAAAAADALARASTSDDEILQETAQWLLANAHLASGQTEAARAVLQEVVGLEGDYAGAARELLARLAR